ncbi:MAG: nucleotidyltransferase domain-containing protein [Sciscionella sp.]
MITGVSENDFLDRVADRLAALPGVQAVSLGGSRAQGTHRPDSDWDLGIYYRGEFDPQTLRDVGWPPRWSSSTPGPTTRPTGGSRSARVCSPRPPRKRRTRFWPHMASG